MKNTHIIRLPRRTGTVIVEEFDNRIAVDITFSRYGDFGDMDAIVNFLFAILDAYATDPRPVVMLNPISGEKAVITGGATHSNATITPGRQKT